MRTSHARLSLALVGTSGDQVGVAIVCTGWYYYLPSVSLSRLVDIIAAAHSLNRPVRSRRPALWLGPNVADDDYEHV